MNKNYSAYIALALVFPLLFPQFAFGGDNKNPITAAPSEIKQYLPLIQHTTLRTYRPPVLPIPEKRRLVVITAYSSSVAETDFSPLVTASGSIVRDGVIACNFLPFGTQVKFPGLYGDKVFVVEDRLARKNRHKIDVWFPSRSQALEFGRTYTEMVIL